MEYQADSVCPCKITEPCSYACSCANSSMSGGCQRCCTYGNEEQQKLMAEHLKNIDDKAVELQYALDQSVKLQSHYAELLNMYDGGSRIVFTDSSEWIARLKRGK